MQRYGAAAATAGTIRVAGFSGWKSSSSQIVLQHPEAGIIGQRACHVAVQRAGIPAGQRRSANALRLLSLKSLPMTRSTAASSTRGCETHALEDFALIDQIGEAYRARAPDGIRKPAFSPASSSQSAVHRGADGVPRHPSRLRKAYHPACFIQLARVFVSRSPFCAYCGFSTPISSSASRPVEAAAWWRRATRLFVLGLMPVPWPPDRIHMQFGLDAGCF